MLRSNCGVSWKAAVLLVAFFALGRRWDTSPDAPARPEMLVSWVAGFAAYQLVAPTALTGWAAGWTTWWTARQAELGIPPGWSASLVSLAVAGVLTLAVGAVRRR